MRRFRPEIIVGTPSYVQRLGAACVEDGLDPRSLGVRALVVAGESYGLAWAQRLQEQWGASLYEQYGCTERAMAWTCPGGVTRDGQLGVLHFPPELAYVEVIDPRTGIQAEDGCEGEIIVTPLQARLSPLLRFSTRDRVQFVAAGSCSCGRPLRGVRAGSVRRYDDMIKVRGVNIWPAQFDAIIFSIPEIAEYRGRVRTGNDGAEHLDLTIEVNDHSALSNEYLVAEVKRSIGLSVQVFSVGPGVLTNSVPEGFVKLSRWQDDRDSVNNSPVTHL